ncbi:hypothetical protein C0991_004175, partial [Blastosporella zonata]
PSALLSLNIDVNTILETIQARLSEHVTEQIVDAFSSWTTSVIHSPSTPEVIQEERERSCQVGNTQDDSDADEQSLWTGNDDGLNSQRLPPTPTSCPPSPLPSGQKANLSEVEAPSVMSPNDKGSLPGTSASHEDLPISKVEAPSVTSPSDKGSLPGTSASHARSSSGPDGPSQNLEMAGTNKGSILPQYHTSPDRFISLRAILSRFSLYNKPPSQPDVSHGPGRHSPPSDEEKV